jgi:hypothetical protein
MLHNDDGKSFIIMSYLLKGMSHYAPQGVVQADSCSCAGGHSHASQAHTHTRVS